MVNSQCFRRACPFAVARAIILADEFGERTIGLCSDDWRAFLAEERIELYDGTAVRTLRSPILVGSR